ncbi:hypothetical protein F5984_18910 [Rudanella paleaurantiibacter]|uniref:Uncharacterized protein n=1 Tax=Rudanella paleaurantiibacter TaxID=2614655 RepID=A0A7J5TVX5_9BACT|nr:hypothetical protein [Rudanella paleaurantiibacter]KAB7728443.1 hypothetical protein F5984_18910 [Rudanella paleaurantiibacter]
MNTNPDERLDQRIRQVLDQLPDAPPPGSTFDAGRLWEQLRPELAAAPVVQPKRPAPVWWAVAAACMGLLLAGVWLYNAQTNQPTRVEAVHLPAPKPPDGPRPQVAQTPESNKPETVAQYRRQPERTQPGNNRIATRPVSEVGKAETPVSQSVEVPVFPASTPGGHVAQLTVPPSLTPLVAQRTSASAAVPAKRRFRVVHENELLTEEETYRIRNAGGGRADRFVRLGSGNGISAASDEGPTMLQLPLQRKQPQ